MANVSVKKNPRVNTKIQKKKESRFLPVILAGIFCALLAVGLGYYSWYFFSVKANGPENRARIFGGLRGAILPAAQESNPENEKSEEIAASIPAATPETAPSQAPPPEPTPEPSPSPTPEGESASANEQETPNPEPRIIEGTVFIKGGETFIGGEGTQRPAYREVVGDFYIAENEVTNAEYAEYTKATRRRAPDGWIKGNFPSGADDYPVTGVSYLEALDYCKWLSKKRGLSVRIPTEVEWEYAAKGREGYKYPWGNEWNPEGAAVRGKVDRIRSYPVNKSPFGAYDMVGNVWEWTSSPRKDPKTGRIVIEHGQTVRLLKGGSAESKQEDLLISSYDDLPENVRTSTAGFRYLIAIPKDNIKK